jgi:hypothetical protein
MLSWLAPLSGGGDKSTKSKIIGKSKTGRTIGRRIHANLSGSSQFRKE